MLLPGPGVVDLGDGRTLPAIPAVFSGKSNRRGGAAGEQVESQPARAEAEAVRKRSKAVPASPFAVEPPSPSAFPHCYATGSRSSYSPGKAE